MTRAHYTIYAREILDTILTAHIQRSICETCRCTSLSCCRPYIVEYQSRPSVRQKINHLISVYPKFMNYITHQEYLDKVNNSLIFLGCSNIDLYMTEVASLKSSSNRAQWPQFHTIHRQIDDDLFGSKNCSIRVKWHELNKNMNLEKRLIYSRSGW